ncbi:MAG: type II toxin-antitoxin system HicA family toxin [Deltaproteobacteria bacterium]|nr:type II toxin-antitoxin system HicA family toxin [Deltaproteobacteria bacterium]
MDVHEPRAHALRSDPPAHRRGARCQPGRGPRAGSEDEADGWYEVRVKGSHRHFKHPDKPGIVTVPHPRNRLER